MKKFLSLVLALVMCLSLVTISAGAVDFTDEAAITKTEAVGVLAGVGIINGYEAADGTFSFAPNGNITRGAAAKIICMIKLGTKVSALLTCEAKPFSDVAVDSTFAPYIAYCANEGIVGGYADGSYKPGNPVTGYAFAKMLLNALGIKGNYEGANYGVNVALAAQEAGLFEGMDADTSYAANCIREDACQMAFNALKYTVDGATSQYVVIDEATNKEVWSGTDALTALALASADGYKLTVDTTYDGSLGDKHFGLKESTDTDNFGRTSKTWTNGETGSKEVIYASVAPEAVLTYTTATTDVKIATALGATNKTGVALTYITNGEEAAEAVTVKKGDTANTVGGQGTLVEVYKTGDKAYDVVIIETFVKKLAAGDIIKANAADEVKAGVRLEGTGDSALTFNTTAFKANDYVLYTKGYDGTKVVIDSVVKAPYISGKVTATASDYVRVDGVQYKLAADNDKNIGDAGYKYTADTVYTYYLDTYGNIIDEKVGETAKVDAKYVFVAGMASKLYNNDVTGSTLFEDATNTTAAAQVKVVDLTTGEISVKNRGIVKYSGTWYYTDETGAVDTDKPVVDDVTKTNENKVYEYYELEDGSIALGEPLTLASTVVTKDKAEVTYGTTKLFTNSATKTTTLTLTYKDNDENNAVTAAAVSTATGIAKKTDTLEKTFVAYDEETKIVSAIYVIAKYNAPTTKANYVFYKGVGESGKDGTGYQFYKNGEVVEYIYTEKNEDKTFKTLTLEEGKAYNVTLTDGKIAKAADAAKATEPEHTAKMDVIAIDDTYLLLESATGKDITVYFKSTGYTVVDKNADYVVDTLTVGDQIWVYGDLDDAKTTFVDADLIVIDNE